MTSDESKATAPHPGATSFNTEVREAPRDNPQALHRQVQELRQEVDALEQRLRTTTEGGSGEPRPAAPTPGNLAREGEDIELWQRREEGLTHRVSELAGHVEALERRLRLLDERRRSVDFRPTRPALEDDAIARRVRELEDALYRREHSAGWRGVIQELADVGLTPAEVVAFARRVARASRDQGISVQDLHQRLLISLENGAVAPGQEELTALETQERQLRSAIASLRREKEDLERRMPGASEQASVEVQRAGEDAAASVRESAVLMRNQLDTLLQDAMDIAGRAAQVDADLRSKEWLGKLLALLEGRKELPAQEVRALGLTITESLLMWVEQHPEQATPLVKEDLERALRAFQGWAGSP